MVLGHLDLPDRPHVGRYVRTGTVCDSTVVGERWGKQQPARVAAAHWGIEHPLLRGPRLWRPKSKRAWTSTTADRPLGQLGRATPIGHQHPPFERDTAVLRTPPARRSFPIKGSPSECCSRGEAAGRQCCERDAVLPRHRPAAAGGVARVQGQLVLPSWARRRRVPHDPRAHSDAETRPAVTRQSRRQHLRRAAPRRLARYPGVVPGTEKGRLAELAPTVRGRERGPSRQTDGTEPVRPTGGGRASLLPQPSDSEAGQSPA